MVFHSSMRPCVKGKGIAVFSALKWQRSKSALPRMGADGRLFGCPKTCERKYADLALVCRLAGLSLLVFEAKALQHCVIHWTF
jgi:hypothetical protein